MSDSSRRTFLVTLAASTLAGVGTARYLIGGGSTTAPRAMASSGGVNPAHRASTVLGPPPAGARRPLPASGTLTLLPPHDNTVALTLDDGVNSEVVRLYTQFAIDTGVRLTYFVNGVNRSWTDHAALLRPLVDSGQIQLANHTWSHPDLTKVSKDRIAAEITRNDAFLKKTYGVAPGPYLRPPYGFHNAAVDAVAADLGYTAITMWSGSLADSTVIHEDYIVAMAEKYFTAGNIVIGHLNHLPVTHVYGQLVDIIRARNLRTVTLNDVFTSTAIR